MPSIWDHDLWQEIYDIPDPLVKNVCVNLYRLVLDMRNADVLAAKIADQVNKDRRFVLTGVQKFGGFILGALILADTISHFFH